MREEARKVLAENVVEAERESAHEAVLVAREVPLEDAKQDRLLRSDKVELEPDKQSLFAAAFVVERKALEAKRVGGGDSEYDEAAVRLRVLDRRPGAELAIEGNG